VRRPPRNNPPGRNDDDDREWSESGERDPEAALRQGFTGSWSRTRPSFDSPMSWSLPLFRVFGIDVRIHLFFLILIAWQVLEAVWPASNSAFVRFDLHYVLIRIAVVFLIVLLHEFGHSLTCRRWGGTSDEILMWPLGGLAYCAPPHAWKAHLATAIGGPMVNVLILAITIPAIGLITGDWLRAAFPNPFIFDPPMPLREDLAGFTLYAFHHFSLVLLLFNLIPLYPLDGGRIAQAIFWPTVGYARSVRFSCRLGFVGAIGLLLAGALSGNMSLVAIAFFGAVTCVRTLQQLTYTEEALGFEDSEGSAIAQSAMERETASERKGREEELKRKAKAEDERAREAAEFDRILDKIRLSGIHSLTAAEKRVLERETERRRRGT
jgi:stage IV sporulation protein FB